MSRAKWEIWVEKREFFGSIPVLFFSDISKWSFLPFLILFSSFYLFIKRELKGCCSTFNYFGSNLSPCLTCNSFPLSNVQCAMCRNVWLSLFFCFLKEIFFFSERRNLADLSFGLCWVGLGCIKKHCWNPKRTNICFSVGLGHVLFFWVENLIIEELMIFLVSR